MDAPAQTMRKVILFIASSLDGYIKMTLKTYYEVPVDIIEDSDLLAEWAKKAIRAEAA